MNIEIDLKDFLNTKVVEYNNASFIESDPISIPHEFERKEDIEISAFLTASIAWGNRKSIINNAKKMMLLLDNAPYDFVVNHQEIDLKKIKSFVHRTFNLSDFLTFIQCLQNLYKNEKGLQGAFSNTGDLEKDLANFSDIFFYADIPNRVRKHVARINKGSAAKRLNMFLRWMVRKDDMYVDFGLWNNIPASALFIPLDVHSGNVARKLGLLTRKQNDWKATLQLTEKLRELDPSDPIKYDYALFGLGVFEGIT